MYEVVVDRQVKKDLRGLPKDLHRKIAAGLRGLGAEPRPPGCRKLTGSASDYRLRVGQYRILYEIDDGERQVRVFRIKHRRDAYRLFLL